MSLTHFSLFSGIGGIDLAAEWAGFTTIGQCEYADYPTRVLEKHWPDVPRWKDVRDVTRYSIRQRGIDPAGITLLSGGFPCQPHSLAGKRKASADERDLWGEFARVICETHPRWVLGENVFGLLSSENGRFFGRVLRDLAEMGYCVGWACYGAVDVGANHRRERVFIVAHAEHARCHAAQDAKGARSRIIGGQAWADAALELAGCGGGPAGPEDVAHSDRERQPQPGREQRESGRWVGNGGQNVADTERNGLQRSEHPGLREREGCDGRRFADESMQGDVSNASIERLEGADAARGICAGGRPMQYPGLHWWSTEPDVGRVVDGVSLELDFTRQIGDWCNDKSGDQKRKPERNELVGRMLRTMWEHRELATTSPDLYIQRLRDSVPEVPLHDSQSRWILGQRIEKDKGVCDLWQDFYAAPLHEKQDMQFKLLERAWEAQRGKTVGNRVDRLKCLGNAVVPQQVYPILRAIAEIEQ